jgi:hypothetical protein
MSSKEQIEQTSQKIDFADMWIDAIEKMGNKNHIVSQQDPAQLSPCVHSGLCRYSRNDDGDCFGNEYKIPCSFYKPISQRQNLEQETTWKCQACDETICHFSINCAGLKNVKPNKCPLNMPYYAPVWVEVPRECDVSISAAAIEKDRERIRKAAQELYDRFHPDFSLENILAIIDEVK